MGDRKKLNSAYAVGSVNLASVVGMLSVSWTVFLLVLVLLLALGLYEGDIRFRGRKSDRLPFTNLFSLLRKERS